MESTEYAVVGAGLSGAATAWHLAARGHDVALLERSTPANDAGSSHGSARIFRYAYPEAALHEHGLVRYYPGMARELERLHGQPGHHPDQRTRFRRYRRRPEVLASVLVHAAGVEHELFTRDEATSKVAADRGRHQGVLHHQGGVIDA